MGTAPARRRVASIRQRVQPTERLAPGPGARPKLGHDGRSDEVREAAKDCRFDRVEALNLELSRAASRMELRPGPRSKAVGQAEPAY